MKKRLVLFTCFALSLLASGDEAAIKSQIKVIEAITTELKNETEEDSQANQSAKAVTQQLSLLSKSDRYSEMYTWLQRSTSSYGQLPAKYNKALSVLTQEVLKHIAELEEQEVSQLETLLERIKTTILKSKQPEDLDTLLSEVATKGQSNHYSSNQNKKLSSLRERVRNSNNIISEWQNYLIAESARDSKACKNSLQNLSRSLTSNPIIPRSYVLRLLNPPIQEEEVQEVQPEATNTPVEIRSYTSFPNIKKSLSQGTTLSEIMTMLESLPPAQLDNSDVRKFSAAVILLQTLSESEDNLLFIDLIKPLEANHQTKQELRSLHFKTALNKILLPKLMAQYEHTLTHLKQKPNTPHQLLEEIFEFYIATKDWENAITAANDQKALARFRDKNYHHFTNKVSAITSIARAEAAIEANEIESALKNYRSSASKTDDIRIFKASFDGIKHLQITHPKEFKDQKEAAKASSALALEERLEHYKQLHMRRASWVRNRNDPNAQLIPLIKEAVETELSKQRLNTLDKELEKSNKDTSQ